ncbi:MAG: HAD family hydrolase [Opitutales bacterium]|nr:HAD family hydrolase [Opitutales bacterium]
MRDLKNYKHIIWDWNGTLLNDFLLCVDCLNEQLQKLQLPHCTPERYREIFDFPLINTYRALGFPVGDPQHFQQICADFMNSYEKRRHNCHLHDGARNFIHRISKMGIGQSIFSAYSHDRLAPVIAEYDLDPYFSCLSGANDLKGDKIARGPAHLRQIGCDPSQVLYVGDTTHDFQAARFMGIDCVIIYHGELAQMSYPRICNLGVPVIRHYTDLLGE